MVWKAYYTLEEAAEQLGANYKPVDLIHYGAIGLTTLVLLSGADKFFAVKRLVCDEVTSSPIIDSGVYGFDMLPLSANDCRWLEAKEIKARDTADLAEINFMDFEYLYIKDCAKYYNYNGNVVYATLSPQEADSLGGMKVNDGADKIKDITDAFMTGGEFENNWLFQLVDENIISKIGKQKKLSFEDMNAFKGYKVSISSLFITHDDLLSLKQDLDSIINKSKIRLENKPVGQRERTTFLHVIGSLLGLLLKDNNGKDKPFFPTQSEVVSKIVTEYEGYSGISKSTLDSLFSEANKKISHPS